MLVDVTDLTGNGVALLVVAAVLVDAVALFLFLANRRRPSAGRAAERQPKPPKVRRDGAAVARPRVVVQGAAVSALGILNLQVQNIGPRPALALTVLVWLSDGAEDPLDPSVWRRLAEASAHEPHHGRAVGKELGPGQTGSVVGFVNPRATAGGARSAVMYATWSYSDAGGQTFQGATNPVLVVEIDDTTDVLQDLSPDNPRE